METADHFHGIVSSPADQLLGHGGGHHESGEFAVVPVGMRKDCKSSCFADFCKSPLGCGNDELIHGVRQMKIPADFLYFAGKLVPVGFQQFRDAVFPSEIHNMLTPLHRMHLFSRKQNKIRHSIPEGRFRLLNGTVAGMVADCCEIQSDSAAFRRHMRRRVLRRVTAGTVGTVLMKVAAVGFHAAQIVRQGINPESRECDVVSGSVTADQVDGMFLFSCEKSLDSNAFPVDAPVGNRVFFDVRSDFSVLQQIFMGAVEKGKSAEFAERMSRTRDDAQDRSPVCGNDTR